MSKLTPQETNYATDKPRERLVNAKTGAPNEGFLQNTLKTLFRLSRVL